MKGSLCRLAETSFLWRDTAMRIRERFNPRAPCGARRNHRTYRTIHGHFNPRAPCGARPFSARCCRKRQNFNPRAPCGARRAGLSGIPSPSPYFNPRAPCGARLCRASCLHRVRENFNPRAPCGARRYKMVPRLHIQKFQPTRPLRGATRVYALLQSAFEISTHAPLAGRDHVAL